jgi:hypothetical protein
MRTRKQIDPLAGLRKSNIPIRTIDFSNSSDKEKHEKMVTLVDRMLDIHKKKADSSLRAQHAAPPQEAIDRMIASTDAEIDRLVY